MFDKPNTTPFPDDLIDKDLRNLSGAETKVLMLIVRKTLGFRKYWDYISINQIEEFTGLSNRSVIDSINNLEENKFIMSQYICCKCGIITSYEPTKRGIPNEYQCKRCNTKEYPNKWYALYIKGEDIKKHLEGVLNIAMKRISANRGYEKSSLPLEKGSEKSSLPLEKGSEKSSLPFIDKDEKGSELSSLGSEKSSQHVVKKVHKGSEKSSYTNIQYTNNNVQDPLLLSPNDDLGPQGSENQKNDDDILNIAEEIADRKIELTEQIVKIQKKLEERYSIPESKRVPSNQFIKDLIRVNESNGGFDYVMKKIDEMPSVMEIDEIGRTLRSWCEHPEKGGNRQKPRLSASEIDKIRLEDEAKQKAFDEIYDRITNYRQELSESELKVLTDQAMSELRAITREEFIIPVLVEAKENEIVRKRLGINSIGEVKE